jgi:endonuclease/exonuclease/phosphatase family metal-dependent hydrolase
MSLLFVSAFSFLTVLLLYFHIAGSVSLTSISLPTFISSKAPCAPAATATWLSSGSTDDALMQAADRAVRMHDTLAKWSFMEGEDTQLRVLFICQSFLFSRSRAIAAAVKRGVLVQQAVMSHLAKSAPSTMPPLHSLLSLSSGVVREPWQDALNPFSQVLAHCSALGAPLRVATFNLWNTQGDWPIRRTAIVAEIRAHKFDVIGLQEVRSTGEGKNQLDLLTEALSDLGYTGVYEAVNTVSKDTASSFEEGLGILSLHPIVSHSAGLLSATSDPPRKVLHAAISVPASAGVSRMLDVFNTHVTYVDVAQCAQIVQLLRFMNSVAESSSASEQVLMGDFNSYMDWEFHLDLLSRPLHHSLYSDNPCVAQWAGLNLDPRQLQQLLFPQSVSDSLVQSGAAFRDLHSSVYPNAVTHPGLTFPTFTDARVADPCRPDRILVRQWSNISGGSLNAPRNALLECDVGVFLYHPLTTNPELTFASDHRGVAAVLDWASADSSADATSMSDRLKQVQAWKSAAVAPNSPAASVLPPPVVHTLYDASVHSSLLSHSQHLFEYAFDGDLSTFFWSNSEPQSGDFFSLNFPVTSPLSLVHLQSVSFNTGQAGSKSAQLTDDLPPENAVLEWGIAVASSDSWTERWKSNQSPLNPAGQAQYFYESALPFLRPLPAGALVTSGSTADLLFIPCILRADPVVPGRYSISTTPLREALLNAGALLQEIRIHALRLRIVKTMASWLVVREIEIQKEEGSVQQL